MDNDNEQPPRERAPLLLAFGEHGGRMAALVRANPGLIARLIAAPREAVHAIGAYLYQAPDTARPDAEVADLIDRSDPRDLLHAAMPNCPPRLYRALDRAGDRVRPRAFYMRLSATAGGPFIDALLDAGPIDDERLRFCEALAAMDPAVATIFAKLKDRYNADCTDSLVAFLRVHGVLGDDDLRLPSQAKLPALVKRLTKALGRIPAPDPGFIVPTPYRLISSTNELQCLGQQFQNCLALHHWGAAEHHLHLINGTGVYLIDSELRVLVSLRRVGGELWVLDQCAGPKNQALPQGTRAAVLRALATSGVKVVAVEPQAALTRLYSVTRRNRQPVGGNIDDAVDDEDEDEEAAA